MRLEPFCLFCGTADAYQQDAGGKRVESSRVAYLDVLLSEMLLQAELEFSHCIGGSPVEGLVEIDHDSFRLIVEVAAQSPFKILVDDEKSHKSLFFVYFVYSALMASPFEFCLDECEQNFLTLFK